MAPAVSSFGRWFVIANRKQWQSNSATVCYYVVQCGKKKVITVMLVRTAPQYAQGCNHHRRIDTRGDTNNVPRRTRTRRHRVHVATPPSLLNKLHYMKSSLPPPPLPTFENLSYLQVRSRLQRQNFVIYGNILRTDYTKFIATTDWNFHGSSIHVLCYQTVQLYPLTIQASSNFLWPTSSHILQALQFQLKSATGTIQE